MSKPTKTPDPKLPFPPPPPLPYFKHKARVPKNATVAVVRVTRTLPAQVDKIELTIDAESGLVDARPSAKGEA